MSCKLGILMIGNANIKNTILRGILMKSESESSSVKSDSLRPHELYGPWNFPGQNTGVGSLSLLQRIFPTEKLNQGLLHCRQILYQLSNQGIPAYQNTGSIVVVHRLSCSMTCGILPDQGLNSCLLHWQEDSLPLSHQGIPALTFLKK